MRVTSIGGSRGFVRGATATALLILAAGCAAITEAEGEVLDAAAAPGIRVEALGGIAALQGIAEIDSATASGAWSMGPICGLASSCVPRDTLVGPIPRGVVEALFLRTLAPEFRALRADYGTSTVGADLRAYLVTIRANGRTRTLRADDGTMPGLMAQFVTDVNAAVIAALR